MNVNSDSVVEKPTTGLTDSLASKGGADGKVICEEFQNLAS
jgi:hypothetical protein